MHMIMSRLFLVTVFLAFLEGASAHSSNRNPDQCHCPCAGGSGSDTTDVHHHAHSQHDRSTKKSFCPQSPNDYCQTLCDVEANCRSDPARLYSYCKPGLNQQDRVCYGLFYDANGKICHDRDPTCVPKYEVVCESGECQNTDQDVQHHKKHAVHVKHVPHTCTTIPPVRMTPMHPDSKTDFCMNSCLGVDSCKNDPRGHYSYCKFVNDPAKLDICFGLYYKDSSHTEMCFQPNDPSCPEKYPVSCTGLLPNNYCLNVCDSVDKCKHDPHSHYSYCKADGDPATPDYCFGLYYRDLGTHEVCYYPNDPTCPENHPVACTTAANQVHPAHCSKIKELHGFKATLNKEALKPTALTTRSPTGKSDYCMNKCMETPSCRDSPTQAYSYCKFDHDTTRPDVCFGLYYKDSSHSEMCFQPNDSSCSEKYPVSCTCHEPTNNCQNLCETVDACKHDPHHHYSYCKFDSDHSRPDVCFGLYYRDTLTKELCYQPADHTCPQTDPVHCTSSKVVNVPELAQYIKETYGCPTISKPKHGKSPFPVSKSGEEDCMDKCLLVDACRTSSSKSFSYCKFVSDPSKPDICFGLYYRDSTETEMCYQPDDPTCPESYPVPCRSVKPANYCDAICDSVDECRNAAKQSYTYCKFSNTADKPDVCFGLYYRDMNTHEVCFHPNDPTCPETHPVACPTHQVLSNPNHKKYIKNTPYYNMKHHHGNY